MELTQSAFNVLLDMTSINDIRDKVNQELKSISKSRLTQSAEGQRGSRVSADSKMTETPESVATKIYYYDGQEQTHLSRAELLDRIQAQPRQNHFIWVPQSGKWESWRAIPNLVRAVQRHTQSQEQRKPNHVPLKEATPVVVPQSSPRAIDLPAQEAHTSLSAQQAHRAQVERSEVRGPLYWPLSKISSKTVKDEARGDYLSIPETAFTRFNLDLSDQDQVTLYVGQDATFKTGGLFIHTPRALNVGDYIQVVMTYKERELLSFEAPISWLRIPRGAHDHFGGGVAIEWPAEITDAQLKMVDQLSPSDEYEYYEV